MKNISIKKAALIVAVLAVIALICGAIISCNDNEQGFSDTQRLVVINTNTDRDILEIVGSMRTRIEDGILIIECRCLDHKIERHEVLLDEDITYVIDGKVDGIKGVIQPVSILYAGEWEW